MSNLKKDCEWCGEKYKRCATCLPSSGAMNWKRYFCSKECYMEYLADIDEKKSKAIKEQIKEQEKQEVETFKDNVVRFLNAIKPIEK